MTFTVEDESSLAELVELAEPPPLDEQAANVAQSPTAATVEVHRKVPDLGLIFTPT
jgi:hypothetical protein